MNLRTLNAKAANFDRIARNSVCAALALALLLVTLLCWLWGFGVVFFQAMYWLHHGEWVALPVEAMFTPRDLISPMKYDPTTIVAIFPGADIDRFVHGFGMKGVAKVLQWVVTEVPVVIAIAVAGFGAFWGCLRVGNSWKPAPIEESPSGGKDPT